MGVYDELSKLDNKSPTRRVSTNQEGQEKLGSRKNKSPVNQSIKQRTNRLADQSIDQFAKVDTLGPIVDRPRAFYITQRIDHWVDEAVAYLRNKGMHKMDRSVLVNTLLHNPELYKPSSLKKLRNRLLAHLTNRSLKRVQALD